MKSRSSRITKNYIPILGITIAILGIILFSLKIWIMTLLTTSLLVLKPNSVIERVWRESPDMHTDVYFFDWTNPEEFYNSSIKPKFEQVGPYTFRQSIKKMDLIWNMNNTVTYSQHRHFKLDDPITNGNLSRDITTFNIFTLCLSHHIRNENYLLKKLVSIYLASSTYINITATPKQIIFDGLDDFILDMGRYFPFISSEIPRFERFDIITLINEYKALEGIFNMGNGVDGDFEIYNWNFNNITPYFDGSCSKVQGSPGEVYSTKKVSKEHIGIFASAICRYVILDFQEEVLVHGIVGYKYSVGKGMLDNGSFLPENECYCAGDCIPSGMLNMSSCRHGFPLFLSLPNFYGADPVYLDSVEGLHPTKDEHETYVVVEPTTGILLNASVRVQINVRLHPIEGISFFENIREMYFPFSWIDQRAVLPDNIYLLLKIYLIFPSLLTGTASFLIILGVTLVCISFIPNIISGFTDLHTKKQRKLTIQEEIPLRFGEKAMEASNT